MGDEDCENDGMHRSTIAPFFPSTRRMLFVAVIFSASAWATLPAHAAIVYSVGNIIVDGAGISGPSSLTVDWDGDGTFEASIAFSPTVGGIQAIDSNRFAVVTAGSEVGRLEAGVQIGPDLGYASSGNFYTGTISFPSPFPNLSGTWVSQGDGYFGFSFDYNGTTAFGWAYFRPQSPSQYAATITEWAFDDTGAPIVTGMTAVPEPATSAFMAGLAGLGVLVVRRRKRMNPASGARRARSA